MVLCNIISSVSNNILRIFLLHTLSAYNSLLICYKAKVSDPRNCLCIRCKHGEGYAYHGINLAPCPRCRKNPILNKLVITNCQPPLFEKFTLK